MPQVPRHKQSSHIMMDVILLHTNIPRDKGINVVCNFLARFPLCQTECLNLPYTVMYLPLMIFHTLTTMICHGITSFSELH